jgi:hypothetical protein
MKRRITTLLSAMLMVLFAIQLSAQVPQAFNYQAVARDASGNLLANHLIQVEVLIHPTDSTTAAVYTETFTTNTNKFGLFTLAIGTGTPTLGTFSTIAWSTGNYWLQVKINLGSGYVNMGASQLLTVPYAMYSANAGVSKAAGSNGEVQFDSTGSFAGNANLFWDNTNKRLGVGITSPLSTFHVNNTAGGRLAYFTGINSVEDAIEVGYGSAAGQATEIGYDPTSNYGYLTVLGSPTKLCMTSTGGVGIGTTTPNSPLQVVTTGYNIADFKSTGTSDARITFSTPGGTIGALGWVGVNSTMGLSTLGATDISFGVSNYAKEVMRLQASSGFVGIGTTTPATQLHVVSGTSQFAATLENASGSLYVGVKIQNTSGPTGVALFGTTTNALNVADLAGGGYLPVNASAFNVTSDLTMKKDIEYLGNEEFANCLTQIRDIKSIRFRYLSESATEGDATKAYRPYLHIGVSAQSLPKEVSVKMDNDPSGKSKEQHLGMSLSDMSGLMLAGIKALDVQQQNTNEIVKAQQVKIESLQAEIESLKAEIKASKKQ